VNILVTGAAGFVGTHLLPALVDAGHSAHGVVRRAGTLQPSDGVHEVVRDLVRPFDGGALPSADAIVHLAQANVRFPDGARELYAVNTVATQALLDHARACGAHFVLASTGSVYGFTDHPVDEDDPLLGQDFYSLTKIQSEALVEAYRPYVGSAILRLFAPYGPGQHGRLVPSLITRIRERLPVTLNGGGQPHVSPIFVDDVVRVILATIARQEQLVANVAGDEVAGIRDLAERIAAALGRDSIFEDGTPDGPGDLVADNGRLHQLFDLRPLVSLDEGLRRTVGGQVPA